MNNRILNMKLREKARTIGLCDQWYAEWTDTDSVDELLRKFKKGIDFCITHNYPNLEFVKQHFERKVLNRNLIFIDEHINISDGPNGVYIINGSCTGKITFRGYTAATLYVRHGSRISIECQDKSKVFVSLYDNATLRLRQKDESKLFAYKRGVECKVIKDGNATVREKDACGNARTRSLSQP